jgi:hypothetical protein
VEVFCVRRHETLLIILGLFIALLLPSAAETKAMPEYSKDLPQSLKNNCNVCHEKASGGPLNDFGQDYAAFNHNMEAVEDLDSDGDGYENGEELDAGTLPGFSSSYPNKNRAGIDLRMVFGLIILLGAGFGLVGRFLRKGKSE